MNNITPSQLQEWVELFWSIGWRGGLVFAILYYRDLVTHLGKTVADVIASWLKRK